MSPLAKIFVVVVAVMSLAAFGSSAALYSTRTNWRKKFNEYQTAHEKADSEKNELIRSQKAQMVEKDKTHVKLSNDYSHVSTEKSEIQDRVNELMGNLKLANVRIDTEVKRFTEMEETNRELQGGKDECAQRLEDARQESLDAKGTAEIAKANMTRFRLDLDKLNKEHSVTLIEFEDLRDEHESAEIQLAAAVTAGFDVRSSMAPPIDAVIQAVKAEDGLVVLSVGKEQKVKKGYKFTVYRGSTFVGKVQVIEVYPDLSGARILYTANDRTDLIQVGDRAATQL